MQCVGNVDHDEIAVLVEQHFGNMPQGTVNAPVVPQYKGGYSAVERDFEQSTIVLSFPAVDALHPLHYAEGVAAAVLGDGMSSPLFNEVREKRGLVYSISAFTELLDNTGAFYITAGTTPDNFDELFDVAMQEVAKLADNVDEKDLKRAKNQIRVSAIRGQERPFGLLAGTIENLFTYGHAPALRDTLDKIEAVNEEDIKAAFQRILTSTPSLTISGKGADMRHYDAVLSKMRH